MSEIYTVVFNSLGSNIINKEDLNNVIYYVNWSSFLPLKYKKFKCDFVFKSNVYIGDAIKPDLVDIGLVSMNFSKTTVFNGTGNTLSIGIISPVVTSPDFLSYYSATSNDNNSFITNYPTVNQVTISFKTLAGIALPNLPDYCLILTLTGIPELI